VLAGDDDSAVVKSVTSMVARRLACAEAGELVRSMAAAVDNRKKEDPAWGW